MMPETGQVEQWPSVHGWRETGNNREHGTSEGFRSFFCVISEGFDKCKSGGASLTGDEGENGIIRARVGG